MLNPSIRQLQILNERFNPNTAVKNVQVVYFIQCIFEIKTMRFSGTYVNLEHMLN
jgi:hypothetical protein